MIDKIYEIETLKVDFCKAKMSCRCSWCGNKIARGDNRVLITRGVLTMSLHYKCADILSKELQGA